MFIRFRNSRWAFTPDWKGFWDQSFDNVVVALKLLLHLILTILRFRQSPTIASSSVWHSSYLFRRDRLWGTFIEHTKSDGRCCFEILPVFEVEFWVCAQHFLLFLGV